MIILLLKLILCIIGAAIGISALRHTWWKKYEARTILLVGFGWRWLLLGIWFFLLGGHASGDVTGYSTHIDWVLDGQVPNRDFSTPYGFYLNYLLAIPYFWNHNPASIVVFVQLLELLGIALLVSTLKNIWGDQKNKLFALLYVSNPLVISWFAFDGQEEALLVLGFALIIWALYSSNIVIKWIVPAVIFLGVKITSVWMIAPFALVHKKSEWIGMAGMLILLALPALFLGSQLIGFTFSRGGDTYDDLARVIFPGNPWYVINSLIPVSAATLISKALMVISLSVALFYLYLKKDFFDRLYFVSLGTVFLTLIYQLTSTYTSPGFLALAVPALLVLLLFKPIDFKPPLISTLALFWSLIVSIDLPIYYRFLDTLRADNWSLYKAIFVAYESFIVIGNALMVIWLAKLLMASSDVGESLSADAHRPCRAS